MDSSGIKVTLVTRSVCPDRNNSGPGAQEALNRRRYRNFDLFRPVYTPLPVIPRGKLRLVPIVPSNYNVELRFSVRSRFPFPFPFPPSARSPPPLPLIDSQYRRAATLLRDQRVEITFIAALRRGGGKLD